MPDLVNPIKRIRETAGKTQKDYASLAGITEQVVLKVEQGLYPTLPPSIHRVAAMLSITETMEGIEDEYEEWIKQELKSVKLPNTILPVSPSDMVTWRSIVCRLNEQPNSVVALCKLLKINPYVIQKFEAGRMKQTPLQLAERIAYIKGEW